MLEDAGLRRARAVVAVTASDADNVYITLSARTMNPKILIHARGESESGLQRLRMAGADQAISAYQWGGLRLAASILRPSVVDFLELSFPGRGAEIDLEEIRVAEGSALIGHCWGRAELDAPADSRAQARQRSEQADSRSRNPYRGRRLPGRDRRPRHLAPSGLVRLGAAGVDARQPGVTFESRCPSCQDLPT